MPQASTFTMKNGAATPVEKTFELVSPAAGDGGIATFVLKEGNVSGAFVTVTASAAKTGVRSRKQITKLHMPSSFVDAASGRTSIGSAALVTITVSIPDDFPESMKADLAAYAKNLPAVAQINAAMKDAWSLN